MFGCLYNPFFMFTGYRYPLYSYNNPGLMGSTQQWYRAAQAESFAHMNLGPYGWASNWGGQVQLNSYDPTLPPSTVMAFQRMNWDPTYVPGMDPALTATGLPDAAQMQQQMQQVIARAAAETNQLYLKRKYTSAVQNVTSLANELTQLLKTEGIPAESKAELEALKQQVEALKKKIEDYAQTSANKDARVAIGEVEAMAGEIIALKDKAIKLAQKIAASKPEEDPAADPAADPTADPAADPAADPTADPTADPAADPAADPEALTPEEASKQYNEKVMPYLNNELLKHRNISAEDKKLIIDKATEFCKAKKEDKVKIFNELLTLISEVEVRVQQNKANEAVSICGKIYTSATGLDWSWCGESDHEKTLKETIKNSITKDNVIDVLDAWQSGDYNSNTGDTCLLETIYGEFQYNTSGIKKDLTNHILNCLEEAAKAKGPEIYREIMPYVNVIKSEMNCTFWSYEKMYDAFNSIHAVLSNLDPDEFEGK